MEESNKLPLKRVELSLSKFNEVAIPHHLDLLRQHKVNIIKHAAAGAPSLAAEQAAAARAAARLRALLAELEALRAQVRRRDWPAFDAATQRCRDLTHRAILDYLETPPPGAGVGGSATSVESVGIVPAEEPETPLLQLQVDDRELELASREEALRGWCALQGEVAALHGAWQRVQAAALAQRDAAAAAGAGVELAAGNAAAARASLAAAERLRAGAWLAGGALAGALAGGPVGLAVGAKAGAAAALAGSLLGCLGARLLGRAVTAAPSPAPSPALRGKED